MNIPHRKNQLPDLFAPTRENTTAQSVQVSPIGAAIRQVFNAGQFNPHDLHEFMKDIERNANGIRME